jgi:hypothetical protein
MVSSVLANKVNSLDYQQKTVAKDIALGKTDIDSAGDIYDLSFAEESRLWQMSLMINLKTDVMSDVVEQYNQSNQS